MDVVELGVIIHDHRIGARWNRRAGSSRTAYRCSVIEGEPDRVVVEHDPVHRLRDRRSARARQDKREQDHACGRENTNAPKVEVVKTACGLQPRQGIAPIPASVLSIRAAGGAR